MRISRLEVYAVPLDSARGRLEAALLYLKAHESVQAVLVDTLSDDRDGDYDFVIGLKGVDSLPDDPDLIVVASFHNALIKGEPESSSRTIRISGDQGEITISPSERFYFSMLVQGDCLIEVPQV